jgi:hypothetical protein
MDSITYDDETVVARHETMAIMVVHLSRIQNLVMGDAPPSPMRVCRLGGPGAVRSIHYLCPATGHGVIHASGSTP